MRPLSTSVVLALVVLLLTLSPVLNHRSAAAELEVGGFGQFNYGWHLADGASAKPGSIQEGAIQGDSRFQLELFSYSENAPWTLTGRLDAYREATRNESGLELQAAYLDYAAGNVALRLGRQIITWGVGDMVAVNDAFPKDWVALFSGRPMEYLKIGTDSLKIDLYAGPYHGQFVFTPYFQPDRSPTGDVLAVPNPFPGLPRREIRPNDGPELATKVSRYLGNWQLSAYATRGFYRIPSMRPDDPQAPTEVLLAYPKLNTFGASVVGSLGGGVLSLAGAYYDSVDDAEGKDPFIENSRIKGLMGYSQALWSGATVNLQLYVEHMQDYNAYVQNAIPGFPLQDPDRTVATLRLTQFLLRQDLQVNLLALVGLSEQDSYIIPSIRYTFQDGLWGELGANIFSGKKPSTSFGALKDNDNIYATIRSSF